jgi:hypothetical protein
MNWEGPGDAAGFLVDEKGHAVGTCEECRLQRWNFLSNRSFDMTRRPETMARSSMAISLSDIRRRGTSLHQQDRLAIQRATEVVKEAMEVLQRCPRPYTFLGRQTYRPFPRADEE